MSNTFFQFNLRPELVQTVADRGYAAPTPIQSALIPVMLGGRDAIGQAQTGTGKTAAFALPLLHNLAPVDGSVQGVVLTPTRELAMQVAEAIHIYGTALDARVLPIYGGQPYNRQVRRLRKGTDVVVGTPGRLLDLIRRRDLDLSQVRTVVLDEADEMLSMGFIDDIEAILEATPSDRQTAFFSATLPNSIRRLADRHMHDPETCRIEPDQRTAGTIEQRYYVIEQRDSFDALVRLLEAEPVESALIFARTRANTFKLAAKLQTRGYAAGALNGEMNQPARTKMLERFRKRQIKILVGTDVASRGLDIDHISHVINYELPRDPEVYVHRVGRTGRAGKTGIAATFVSSRDRGKLRKIERYTKSEMTRATLPSEADVKALRDARLGKKMTERLQKNGFSRERDIATALVEDGHDPIDIAAAALKTARGEEKDSSNGTAATKHNGSTRSDRPSSSHEQGMVRLTLDTGQSSGTRPGHVVSSISHFGGIPGSVIGKIRIQKRHTFVDVPAKHAEQVLAQSGSYRIRNRTVRVERA